MRRTITLFALLILVSCRSNEGLKYVNPLIGSEGEGTEYGGMMPYAGVPFGSLQWSPMTRLTEVGTTSYNSSDSLLLGFIGSRQPAIWMGDWGQVSFQAQLGDSAEAEYSKRGQLIQEEKYTPYDGYVTAGGVTTHYAGLEHSSIYKFSSAKHIVIDASRIAYGRWSDHHAHPGHIEFSEDGLSASGWNTDMFDGGHTTPKPNFKSYFYIRFSRPYNGHSVIGDLEDGTTGIVDFTAAGPVTISVGVSLVSAEQAKKNLELEVGDKSVEAVARKARQKWGKIFDRLKIEANTETKTIFYTALYHSLLYPRQIDEYGRYYSAFDDEVHDGKMYSCWSMWDTYRAEHPLLTLVAPERVDEMMQSLVEMYHEGGWLPKWPNPGYTGIMVGSPAETIIAEAYTKGFRGFDVQEAYAAVKKSATVPQPNDRDQKWKDRGNFGDTPETRAGLGRYMELGYVAADETYESVSRTLDFGLQDVSDAILAEGLGYSEDAGYFRDRALNYRNLWNSEYGCFAPRNADGSWVDPYSGYHYTECSPATALWNVPYDIDGLAGLVGGQDKMELLLDKYFDEYFWKPERGNISLHGNEPTHHIAYMYNRIGAPAKTQQRVREILSKAYSSSNKGFDGNEDCGQMSAWYILSSLGLYMLNPADGWYEIGSPSVSKATLVFDYPYSNSKLHIVVHNQSKNNYLVSKVTFNGEEIKDWRIHHNELVKGGTLEFYF